MIPASSDGLTKDAIIKIGCPINTKARQLFKEWCY